MRRGLLAILLFPLLLSPLRAEDPPPPVEIVPAPKGTKYEDVYTGTDRYALHDVLRVHVHAEKAWLQVWVVFREPLKDGMYEAINLYLDCDADRATGIYGADLFVRVSAGSRFRPNTEAEPPAGLRPAFQTRTAAWAVPRRIDRPGGGSGVSWIWSGTTPVLHPCIDGAVYFFTLPLQMLKENGLRYNARVGIRFEAESVLAEQPVWLSYRCVDDGVEIQVDGSDEDWSGGPRATDGVGEMHPAAEGLDIRDLQVEHGKDRLFARLRLARPGFGPASVPPSGDDISVYDSITLAFEPLGDGSYMEYRSVEVSIHTPRSAGDEVAWVVGDRMLEMGIARPAAQTEFRVMAWSDARRVDRIPDSGWEFYDIPASAWNR